MASNPPALPVPLNPPPRHLPLGSADQACKECRRRKAKCDRVVPTCNLCVKYRRHCLYEKHSRTPLTRKHLTEVEERLERAEALVAQFRSMVPPRLRQGIHTSPPHGTQSPRTDSVFEFPTQTTHADASTARNRPDESHTRDPPQPQSTVYSSSDTGSDRTVMPSSSFARDTTMRQPERSSRTGLHENARETDILEASPADDFEWDEQVTMLTGYTTSPDTGQDDTTDEGAEIAADGMASLSVRDRESGYLGVASGAALLRLLEPTPRPRTQSLSAMRNSPRLAQQLHDPLVPQLRQQPDPSQHITDAMIDGYFGLYHLSYPLVHEASFRAQYSGVIPRPGGACWTVLAYTMAAIGVYTTSPGSDNLDLALFSHARSILSFNFLELGNVPLVQALTLMANYLQKRNKPNSAYNYLGLAVRMAMGIGLHKEFQGWNISPLKMEIRRRVWWVLCVIDMGATITFSRPSVFPFEGIEVSLPLNVDDRALTALSKSYPPETDTITPYTAVRTQASFHVATTPIYNRVISKPLPTAKEMLRLDEELLQPWLRSVPSFFSEEVTVPPKYTFAQYIKKWRYLNMRIIMYRTFVIRRALHVRERRVDGSAEDLTAYERCLGDARETIASISDYWVRHEHNRIAAWYALYFLFQAALIPCICLRNEPASHMASDWKDQITTTTRTILALSTDNSSSSRCYRVIMDLCGDFLDSTHPADGAAERRQPGRVPGIDDATPTAPQPMQEPTDTSPQTQINSVLSMMWPNVPPLEAADVVMGDDAWMDFLRGGVINEDDGNWFDNP